MKLKTFFEKFDQFAEAPNAVGKMRELVLHLAVTGKLVTRNKRDEPASMILEAVEAERAKLLAAKKIKSRPIAPVEEDEQPFELPASWTWARLSDIGYELGQKFQTRFSLTSTSAASSLTRGALATALRNWSPATLRREHGNSSHAVP